MHGHSHGHHHGHSHGHDHGQAYARSGNARRLTLTLLLAGGYMIAEAVGGLLANSLALLADAGHMLSDVGALALSLFAIRFADRPADPKRTFGYYRAEILAALANGATLVAIAIYIFIEALQRFQNPPEVQGQLVMGIAVGGLIVNLLGLWILSSGKESNLNMRGAWLHVLTDALGSVGAILAGVFIWAFQWHWVDPAFSILIAFLVVHSSWALLKESVSVLMESAPGHIDVDEVRNALLALEGVQGVHDVHVWTITTGMESLSAHIVTSEENGEQWALLKRVRNMLHDRFGIDHTTIQIEPPDFEEHGIHQ